MQIKLSQRAREMLALLWIGLSLYVLLSLATFQDASVLVGGDSIPRGGFRNLGGSVGYTLAAGLLWLFGLAGYLPFLFLIVFGLVQFLGRQVQRPTLKAIGVVAFTALVAALMSNPSAPAVGDLYPHGAGGRFGATVSPALRAAFGGPGRLLLLLFGVLLSFLLATEWVFSQVLLQTTEGLQRLWTRLRRALPAWVRKARRELGAGSQAAAAAVEADAERGHADDEGPKQIDAEIGDEEEEEDEVDDEEEEEEEDDEEGEEDEENVDEGEDEVAPAPTRWRARSWRRPRRRRQRGREAKSSTTRLATLCSFATRRSTSPFARSPLGRSRR